MDEKTPSADGAKATPEAQPEVAAQATEGTAEVIASDGTPEVITAETVTTEQEAPVAVAGSAEVIASDGAEDAIAAAAVEPAVVETQATTITVEDAPEAGQPPAPEAGTAVPVPAAGAPVPPPPPTDGTAAAVPQPPATPPTGQPSPTGALVCGILAILFSGLAIVGIVLGIVAIVLAGKYFKAGGTQGTGKAGRICGIVGIVLSVVWLVAAIAVSCMAFTMADSYSSLNSLSSSSSSSATTVTAEATEAQEAVEMRLDQIKNKDPEMMAALAAIAEKSFEDTFSTGSRTITMQDCGIDPNEYIALMTDGFDYKFDSFDEHGSYSELTYYLTVRDITQITNVINDEFDSGAIQTMGDAELRQYIGKTVMDAVRNADMTHYEIGRASCRERV